MPDDSFARHAASLHSPALRLEPITPDDGTDLTRTTRAINVAQTGTVRVVTAGGDTADIYIAAGIAFPVRATRVMATGTTATGICGMS
jgi:hypothetical protein